MNADLTIVTDANHASISQVPAVAETSQVLASPAPTIRMMGELEVASVPAPSAQMMMKVMALLALNAGRPVYLCSIMEELWGDHPPYSGKSTVHTYLSKTNAFLGGLDPIVKVTTTTGSAYRLELEPHAVDVLRFMQLVDRAGAHRERGEMELAQQALEEALPLVTGYGPFLEYIECGSVLAAAAADFEEYRQAAMFYKNEVGLVLGRHEALLREILAEWRANPCNESLAAQAMIALHRCGRRSEVSEVFLRTRSVLQEDHGIEPCRPLQQLLQQILRDDFDLPRLRRSGTA